MSKYFIYNCSVTHRLLAMMHSYMCTTQCTMYMYIYTYIAIYNNNDSIIKNRYICSMYKHVQLIGLAKLVLDQMIHNKVSMRIVN